MITSLFIKDRIAPLISGICILLSSCTKGPQGKKEVYANNFESSKLTGISSGLISKFGDSNVLGRYNNGGFFLKVENLSNHDLVEISFDLFIHDSWDGNTIADGVGGPDLWQMEVDGSKYVYATFCNKECPPQLCTPQSYPADFPNNNHFPKSGAFRTDLPGACHLSGHIGGTTQYKIVKTIKHRNKSLTLNCRDFLKQSNSPSPICDESWSVDNISIKEIVLNN